ncbi:hypothetical protein LINPERHAP2_LOCUS14186 [Linum perenne]
MLKFPGSQVLSTGLRLMWTGRFFGAPPGQRLEELSELRMGGLLVLLSLIWVHVLSHGPSSVAPFWVWSWHGLWATVL